MAKLWEVAKRGAPPAFESPDEMWSRATEYFQWCEDNPIEEDKVFSFQGVCNYGSVSHIRAMTQAGLCIFLKIGVSTWHDYKKKDEYSEVTTLIEKIMYEQKFSGAASGMLNANIIARDLGLVDKTESNVKLSDSFEDLLKESADDD